MNKTWMVIDVESIGLHGEAFAVGVVQIVDGLKFNEFTIACSPSQSKGTDLDREWVDKNCPPIDSLFFSPREVRDEFWDRWMCWQERFSPDTLIAECSWPVETSFISRCISDEPNSRNWLGPYPMHDLASMRLIKGFDPLATLPRLPGELPAHHPLHDARQSARLLMELINDEPNYASSFGGDVP